MIAVRHGRQKRRGPWRFLGAVLASVLAVVLVATVSVVAISAWQFTSGLDTVDIGDGDDAPIPDIGAYPGGFNMLIVGSDLCVDEDDPLCIGRDAAELNDVNILLHVAEDHSNAVAISIPRDLLTPVPACKDPETGAELSPMGFQQINSVLGHGGLACVVDTVEELSGLEIPFAGMITFRGVIQMSNAVGGVPVCLAGDVEDTATGFSRPAGEHVLSGEDALAFLRSRKGVGDGGDLARISSQQVYLSSLVRTLKSSETLTDPGKVYGLAQAARDNMTLSTSLASLDTMAAIAQALAAIPLENVTFVSLPVGESAFDPNRVEVDEVLADQMFDLVRADQRFVPGTVGGEGATIDPADPAAPAPTEPVPTTPPAEPEPETDPAAPQPTETTDPAEPPVLPGVSGSTAAQRTCTVPSD